MAFFLSPVLNEQQFDANGEPLAGGLIYSYLAGTTTPVTVYKTSTGTAHSQPIVLDSSGNFPTGTQLWLDGGKTYKFVVQTSTGVTLRTIDNITGINDSNLAPDQWVQYTTSLFSYLNATQFSVVGDQTNTFQIGRRVRSTNTGGTIYSTITNAVYSAPNTTVTVVNDAGTLDAGLSAVYYGLLSSVGPSYPNMLDNVFRLMDDVDRSKKAAFELSGISPATTRTFTLPNKDGTLLLTDDVRQLIAVNATVAANALTISIPSPINLDFRSATLGSGAISTVSGTPANLVISSGSTLGTTNALESELVLVVMNNAGTMELAIINPTTGVMIDEKRLISTTAEGGAGAADSANTYYSTTARSNLPFRILGTIRSTQAVAGTWATAPAQIQSTGGAAAIPTLMNAQGNAPMFAVRAWVNFNGTGVVAIRGSGNVSGITDNGTGDYTVNFLTALQDANYSVSGAGQRDTAGSAPVHWGIYSSAAAQLAGSCRIQCQRDDGTPHDPTIVTFTAVR